MSGRDEGGASDDLIVARVRRPHGIRGEILVSLDTDRPRQVFRSGKVLKLGDGRARPTGRMVVVAGMRPTTGGGILRLEGVDSREAAETLRGHMLLIAANEAQPAASDEVHYRDLIGLRASAQGGEIGRVEDLIEMPSGVMLIVRGSEGREILIPFVKDVVEAVDIGAGTLALRLPEGLLEL